MKKIILLLAIITLFSCKKETKVILPTPVQTEEKTENLDWLLGHWERVNEEVGKQTFESWAKTSNTEYVGLGFTMKQKDTLSKENMRIAKTTNNQWVLTVKSVGKGGDSTPVSFKMTKLNATSFTCENKEIDFPNTIHYAIDGKQMRASVSNSDMEIPFVFERVKK